MQTVAEMILSEAERLPEGPKTVQTFAGHSSLQVTMDRYGHLFKSDDHKKAMDAIANDMFGYRTGFIKYCIAAIQQG
jgi:integrase